MNIRKITILLIGVLFFAANAQAQYQPSKEQTYSLFEQANQAFRQANSIADNPQKAEKLYETAILNYEKIINDGRIKNAKLFYNLGNAYFLKGELGKAILNYRRAEELDKNDANIHKNLAFARSRRIDEVKVKTEKRVLQTLFFWHYDFSLGTKFLVACLCFAIVCVCLTIMIWLGKSGPVITASVIAGILVICFAGSVFVESFQRSNRICGVIIADSVVARQGDGQNYPVSFKEPLHTGTEFDLLEQRPGWLHIKLSDDSDGWIPETSADLI
jgi:hypothetical protein